MYEQGRIQGQQESQVNWNAVTVYVYDSSIAGQSYDLYYGGEYVGGGQLQLGQ